MIIGGFCPASKSMRWSAPTILALLSALILDLAPLEANNRSALELSGRRADRVENQRFEKKTWQQPQSSSLMEKRFPLEEWDKHFSSIGSKRAPISVESSEERQIYETKRIDREKFPVDMARWNERMADLHKKAGIEMSEEAELVMDQQMYSAMLQDTQQFKDMAENLSLRDINRYQFRRNRSEGDVPVEPAGSGN